MSVILVFLIFAAAVSAFEPINNDYHNSVGVFEAARIKRAEDSTDFDGARILGGESTWLTQFPFLGGLIIPLVDGRQSVCGSSLLTNTRLVTAAHCWRSSQVQALRFIVVLGSTRLFSGGVRISTNNVQTHEHYNSNTLNNDIAIITISSVQFNNNISPIALASGSNQYVGIWATIPGFGRSFSNINISVNQTSRYGSFQIINNEICANTYGSTTVTASTICVSTGFARGICGGDFGGPLTIRIDNIRQLVGVASFTHAWGCAFGFPAGLSRITYFNSWITARL